MTNLEKEIDENRRKIHTDAYPMSIGEIANLYKDGELDIHPEFQRIYRWTDSQKSKLIESILLGIPLPSIFVAQRDDGIWDVVDGLQRLSTIFSFWGIYKDENGKTLPPLKLTSTEYIPSLEGIYWEHPEPKYAIPDEIRRTFKREKIDFKIIKKESDEKAKYDLFQRLNTGGTKLSEQEVRNCLLIMLDHSKYDWLKLLSENENFQNCLPITDKKQDEQAYMEIALRFIIYRYLDKIEIQKHSDLNELLTDAMKIIFINTPFDLKEEQDLFEKVFKLLDETLNENSFRRYNPKKNKYEGPFSLSIFEIIAIGLSFNISKDISELKTKIIEVSESIQNNPYFIDNTKYGTRSIDRFKILTEFGKTLFK
ncbi:DUF262 domain-containing protein [Aliarcobacter butzleri]